MESYKSSASLLSSDILTRISILVALSLLTFLATAYALNTNVFAEKFRATMSGAINVLPVNTTAGGYTSFRTASNDTVLKYKVNVTGLTDVTGAHIHQGKSGQNGDIIVDLLNNSKKNKIKDGIAIRGNITISDLIGAMKVNNTDILLSAIGSGNTYVDIHTLKYPDGEIRGQIELENGKDLNQTNVSSLNKATLGA